MADVRGSGPKPLRLRSHRRTAATLFGPPERPTRPCDSQAQAQARAGRATHTTTPKRPHFPNGRTFPNGAGAGWACADFTAARETVRGEMLRAFFGPPQGGIYSASLQAATEIDRTKTDRTDIGSTDIGSIDIDSA